MQIGLPAASVFFFLSPFQMGSILEVAAGQNKQDPQFLELVIVVSAVFCRLFGPDDDSLGSSVGFFRFIRFNPLFSDCSSQETGAVVRFRWAHRPRYITQFFSSVHLY